MNTLIVLDDSIDSLDVISEAINKSGLKPDILLTQDNNLIKEWCKLNNVTCINGESLESRSDSLIVIDYFKDDRFMSLIKEFKKKSKPNFVFSYKNIVRYDCGCIFDLMGENVDYPLIRCSFDIKEIPLNCKDTWKLISEGNTVGVFQLESQLGQHLSKDAKPQNIEELAALISIMRPGCMEAKLEDGKSVTDHYIMRKNNEEPSTPFHPLLDPILSPTMNCLIFQESMLEIAQKIGGFDLKEADFLRKSIGTKNVKSMGELKDKFINGCVTGSGLKKKEAQQIFSWIEKSQRYSFNKCIVGTHAIKSVHKNDQNLVFTLAELYKIKWDKEFAKGAGVLDIHKRWNDQGFISIGYSMDNNYNPIYNKIKDVTSAGKARIKRIRLDDSSKILCTLNHRIPTLGRDVLAKELKKGHILFQVKNGKIVERKIVDISTSFNSFDVYDVEMFPPYHNFALDNGVIVSNSHAVEYAYLSYQTAYAKTHFPEEFYTTYMNHSKFKPKPHEELKILVKNARNNNVILCKPDVRYKNTDFILNNRNNIIFGLSHIKDVGESTIVKFLELLKDFDIGAKSWSNILFNILLKINKTASKALISSGALSFLNKPRMVMLHEHEYVLQLTDRERDWIINNIDLGKYNNILRIIEVMVNQETGKNKPISNKRRLVTMESILKGLKNPPYSIKDERNKIIKLESSFLSYPLTHNLFDSPDTSLVNATCQDVVQRKIQHRQEVYLAGEIQFIKEVTDKAKNHMAFVKLTDDSDGVADLCFFSPIWKEYKSKLEVSMNIIVKGTVSWRKKTIVVVINCDIL